MELIEDPHWRRVAAHRPALRLHVRVQRCEGRDGPRFLLCDELRRRFHHVDAQAWRFIGRLDGRLSVDEAWKATYDALGEEAPTQAEAIRMLQHLAAAGLLTLDAFGQAEAVARRRRQRRSRLRAAAANPLSFRVPLLDPQPLLDRMLPLARALVSPYTLAAWAVLAFLAANVMLQQGSALLDDMAAFSRTPHFLLQIWLVYPLAKLCHEAGHALSLRAWGGEVRQCGVNMLLLTPLPYVDASSATALPLRRQRILVSAMGVLVETALASAALLVWSTSSSAELRQWCLALAAGCGISTVVFNLNPLARFDGYYILADLLDLPNLAARGRAMIAWQFKRLCAGRAAPPRPEPMARVATVVTLHATLAWLWQAFVSLCVAAWLFESWPVLGAGVLAASAVGLLWRPAVFALRFVLSDPRLAGRRARPLTVMALGVPALAVALVALPLPSSTTVAGVVWAAPESIVRSGIDGDVVSVLVQDGQRVRQGQPLVVLENLQLRSQHATASARVQALDIRLGELLLSDPAEAAKLAAERDAAGNALQRLDEQLAQLTILAGTDGTLAWPREGLHPDRPCRQGEELGYVLPDDRPVRVKVALDEPAAARLRAGTREVRVVLDPADPVPAAATLEREAPAASRTLPVPALAESAGGPVRMDPTDPEGKRTLVPVEAMDVIVRGSGLTHLDRARSLGGRAWVRFDHAAEPLAERWLRALRQAFLGQLGAGA